MSDPISMPTVAPTGDPAVASLPPTLPVLASPAAPVSPVNPAQASTPTNTNPNFPDVSAMMQQYEGRIRTLMSEKDKAINERNQAITAQAQMQQSLTEYQNQASSTLASTTTAAQQAID